MLASSRSALGTAAPWASPPVLNANFATTVYHGLPSGLHRPIAEPQGGYVAFLGRISLAVKDGDRVERGQVLPTVGDEKFVLQRRSLDAQIAGLLSL